MKNQRDLVIIVNEKDEWLGTMEKLYAHEKGVLHRAFSVFIFNNKGEMLLQQRALTKYHSGGLWSNACCSHPFPGEGTKSAAHRRLQEELGFDCSLEKIFTLRYTAAVNAHMTENEYDHCYMGKHDGIIICNPAEVAQYRFEPLPIIEKEIQSNPGHFTPWFILAFPKLVNINS